VHRHGRHDRRIADRLGRGALRGAARRRRAHARSGAGDGGTGGNSTAEAIALSRHAAKVGADCTLSVVPYYNKPSQEGLYQHFKAIAEAVDIPMVLYNVPGRTVADCCPRPCCASRRSPGSSASRKRPATSNAPRS
jgi:4-hydroxy-tetrahydrodipicolinate synthase